MTIAIGDVHGCYKTLLALLKKLPDDEIVFTGDLIDRGPDSMKVVRWMLGHQDIASSVIGNHEQMAISSLTTGILNNMMHWIEQGGLNTLISYYPKENSKENINKPNIYKSHLNFLKNLPLYIDKGDLLITHSSLPYMGITSEGIDFEKFKKIANPVEDYTWHREDSFLGSEGWMTELPNKVRDKFHIYGHTSVDKPLVSSYSANIDTGCIHLNRYGPNTLGNLTAFQYPEMKIFTQKCLD